MTPRRIPCSGEALIDLHASGADAPTCDDWDRRLWAHAWEHFLDRRHDDEKGTAGKTDDHTMGACHELLALIRDGQPRPLLSQGTA